MHLSLAISDPWLKTTPLDLSPGIRREASEKSLIETLYGRTVEDCALVIRWPMDRLSGEKRTKVLRYGVGTSTGTLPSILGRLL